MTHTSPSRRILARGRTIVPPLCRSVSIRNRSADRLNEQTVDRLRPSALPNKDISWTEWNRWALVARELFCQTFPLMRGPTIAVHVRPAQSDGRQHRCMKPDHILSATNEHCPFPNRRNETLRHWHSGHCWRTTFPDAKPVCSSESPGQPFESWDRARRRWV